MEVQPEELGFRQPFTTVVKQSLTVHNKSDSPIAFKVKTTAPKQYCVRPNSGRLAAHSSTEVSIMLQPMPDPPADFKCKDKFLVQAIRVSADLLAEGPESEKVAEAWANADKQNKIEPGTIMEQKIKCTFFEGSPISPKESPSVYQSEETPQATINRLNAQINEYKAEIERLNALRQRKGEPAVAQTPRLMKTHQSQAGLPMHVVLGIAIIAFLIGAIFY
jgi:hypothetical protein